MPIPANDSGVTSVDYPPMDRFQQEAAVLATTTNPHAERFDMHFVDWTRGESVQVFSNPKFGFCEGRVLEDLGTKERVASAVAHLVNIGTPPQHAGRVFDDSIAQCTFAMAANDLITLGIMPTDVRMHIAVGRAEWFRNTQRYRALNAGWKRCCDHDLCVWTGGETAQLSDVVMPDAVVLSGGMSGRSIGNHLLDPATIRVGDRIIFAESSGIHANGLTDARAIADQLPDGYLTEVIPGKTYGELLLRPTHLYRKLVEECIRKRIALRYCINITGHGWRKLMRARQPFRYVIDSLPEPDPIFDFIKEHGRLENGKPFDDYKMFSTFNIKAGFALIIGDLDLPRFYQLVVDAFEWPFRVFNAGHIEAGPKSVRIEPVNLDFGEETLQIR